MKVMGFCKQKKLEWLYATYVTCYHCFSPQLAMYFVLLKCNDSSKKILVGKKNHRSGLKQTLC